LREKFCELFGSEDVFGLLFRNFFKIKPRVLQQKALFEKENGLVNGEFIGKEKKHEKKNK